MDPNMKPGTDDGLNWTTGSSAIHKDVSNAARAPEGGPAEVGGLPASSLPKIDKAPSDMDARRPSQKAVVGSKANSKLMQSA